MFAPLSRRRVAAAVAVSLTVVALAGCSSSSAPAPAASVAASVASTPAASVASAIPAGAFDPVLALIVQRLATGDAVAAAKHFSGQPVTDAAREKAVLDAAAARAAEIGADLAYVAAVFADQISASKQIQQSLLDAWASGAAAPPATAPDLATEVRPVLDAITQDLVPALAAVERYRTDPGCASAVAEAASAAATAADSATSGTTTTTTTATTATPSAAAAAPPGATTVASPTALAALPAATAHLCG
ncbi:gamma subclass chorismate mutase AroQ [Herbiconiux sp. 11R-BC]|uniref:gamma subclass chorismate mutase AroQ n=1 Tax=Herbiconiux sp. 11R-BC TaxID=3111637 RepID=UPI003C0C72D3